jgi:hypothetical protein
MYLCTLTQVVAQKQEEKAVGGQLFGRPLGRMGVARWGIKEESGNGFVGLTSTLELLMAETQGWERRGAVL